MEARGFELKKVGLNIYLGKINTRLNHFETWSKIQGFCEFKSLDSDLIKQNKKTRRLIVNKIKDCK